MRFNCDSKLVIFNIFDIQTSTQSSRLYNTSNEVVQRKNYYIATYAALIPCCAELFAFLVYTIYAVLHDD